MELDTQWTVETVRASGPTLSGQCGPPAPPSVDSGNSGQWTVDSGNSGQWKHHYFLIELKNASLMRVRHTLEIVRV